MIINIMYDPNKHNRKSIRLKNFDYSQSGCYFITICTANRFHLFGKIKYEKMVLNEFGEVAQSEWKKTERLRKNVQLDEFVIMPNHVHGIIVLNDNRRGTTRRTPTVEQFGQPTHNSIPTIIRAYKSAVTRTINIMNNTLGSKIWQRNYYERIIRTRQELINVRSYIQKNPANWNNDKLNQATS